VRETLRATSTTQNHWLVYPPLDGEVQQIRRPQTALTQIHSFRQNHLKCLERNQTPGFPWFKACLKHVESQQKTSMIRSHGPISWQDGLWGSRKGHLAGRLLLLKPHVKITQVTLGM